MAADVTAEHSERHKLYEDVLAMLLGTLFVALGVVIYAEAMLLVGGSRLMASWVDFSYLDPAYAAVMGGGLSGMGLLMLFRHRTGLGGLNILALYLQETWGIRAGYFQLAVDLAILAAAFFVLTPDHLLLSVLGTAIVNMILAINHKPGRYRGVT